MKKILLFHFVVLLLQFNYAIGQEITENSINPGVISLTKPQNYSIDSFNIHIIKINPVQIIINEISISYEKFIQHNRSRQLSLGFVYPTNIGSSGEFKHDLNSMCEFVLSDHSRCPFINTGISAKAEFRKYTGSFFHTPQIMYKFLFYNKKNVMFRDSEGDSHDLFHLKSEYANVIGLGYFIGFQNLRNKLNIDFYTGIGLRSRFGKRIIYSEHTWNSPNFLSAPVHEGFSKIYLAFNLGLKIGFHIKEKRP
ncbi:MAG: hypothetical protein KAX05_04025 [Bacteroidales bacterium]|nr:hypothetical protein [Bacteroidales bacterium]